MNLTLNEGMKYTSVCLFYFLHIFINFDVKLMKSDLTYYLNFVSVIYVTYPPLT